MKLHVGWWHLLEKFLLLCIDQLPSMENILLVVYVDESMAQKSITEVPHTQMMRGPHTHHYVLGLHIMF